MRHAIRYVFPLATAAVALLVPPGARADFTVAGSSLEERAPSVAYNPTRGQFAVVWLEGGGINRYVRARIFDAWGDPVSPVRSPFGTGLVAKARPEIVYNPIRNEYLVAAVGDGATGEEILVRRLDADGNNLIGPNRLFEGLSPRSFSDYTGVSPIRAVHNEVLDEYVVTVGLDTGTSSSTRRGIWGQRVRADMSWFGSEVKLTDAVDLETWSHSIAHASVVTTPHGGRYLFAYSWGASGSSRVDLLNENLAPIVSPIPFDWGSPAGQSGYCDVAFGVVHNAPRFLVVWSDGNNDYGTTDWTGIWGSYLDPHQTTYPSSPPQNIPFPISYVPYHPGTFQHYKPRVATNHSAQTFFVVWTERPSNVPENAPDLCTHIRGVWVDFLEFNPSVHPYPNVVVSDVTCYCPPPPGGPSECLSVENPLLPDVAPMGSGSAVAVWEQTFDPVQLDQDVAGDVFGHPRPANDFWTGPEALSGTIVEIPFTLLGAANDGSAACDGGGGEPDVWYRYTAPSHGTLVVSTCGTHDMFGVDTGIDTVVSLHDPADASPLALEACNDDFAEWEPPNGCVFSDAGFLRDSFMSWALPEDATCLIRATRFHATTGGRGRLQVEFLGGVGGAGHVPSDGAFSGGAPLILAKGPGEDDLTLLWDESCLGSDLDFAVYHGAIGDSFDLHEPVACGTGGATSLTIAMPETSRYYLVVPRNRAFEGSYGLRSAGIERFPGPAACLPQLVNDCP